MTIRELIPWMSEKSRGDLARGGEVSPYLSLQQEMNRMFDEFFEGFDLAPFRGEGMTSVAPKVDVAETESEIHVTAELPGLTENEVEVTLAEGSLTLRGEKKSEKEDKQKNYHRTERSYGMFERTIPLPAEVDREKVEATFTNGVLSVVLQKLSPSVEAGRKISVKRG